MTSTPAPDPHPAAPVPGGRAPVVPNPEGVPAEYRPYPVSFVRRSARLTAGQDSALNRVGSDYLIDVPRAHASTSISPEVTLDLPTEFGRTARTVVEIGSGMGECVSAAALANPETNFLAVEVYLAGIAQAISLADRAGGAPNLRLIEANAPEVLDALPAASLDEIWVFFPDPWHKARHHKRRLVQPDFATQLARVLRPGGIWRLATDWEPYADHMREVLRDRADLVPLIPGSDGVTERFEGRVLTTFEEKGRRAGRGATDLAYVRV
ncbi:tRNA (guanosine(46)-N7)-methyltransferase TrmB [Mycetocola tolaasinivorans]|uniref:tRNA (guanine-N(7)-)-methyltransferase n=1 Tax=Mycetocola tolaasinivorans TaxID=76635 RepID=A0A3L7AB69_9MICO|nr:tRNA (guanosine(46)-N7)-methyltransferase TrmB [Mycetocola tolaasinivorans]RLP77467.1 tRNA (guanosine(46)-N7)-methyltransferase TrmB [Mycetocola tolaasinivorans]